MKKNSLVRTIYLYLFALLGLVLSTIGSVRFLDMGLKAFIFTKAEEEQRLYNKQPPFSPVPIERIAKTKTQGEKIEPKDEIKLSAEEKTQIDQWITEYNNWQETRSKIDPITSRRHRDASLNLAMILIGLPLYLYHWGIIKRETKNQKDE